MIAVIYFGKSAHEITTAEFADEDFEAAEYFALKLSTANALLSIILVNEMRARIRYPLSTCVPEVTQTLKVMRESLIRSGVKITDMFDTFNSTALKSRKINFEERENGKSERQAD